MKDLAWHAISREELAALIGQARQLTSRALGATTLYQLQIGSREILAMALPDGHALVVETAQAKWRRRIDPQRGATPASR